MEIALSVSRERSEKGESRPFSHVERLTNEMELLIVLRTQPICIRNTNSSAAHLLRRSPEDVTFVALYRIGSPGKRANKEEEEKATDKVRN